MAKLSERKAPDLNEVLTVLGKLFVLVCPKINYRFVVELQVDCELCRQVVIVE